MTLRTSSSDWKAPVLEANYRQESTWSKEVARGTPPARRRYERLCEIVQGAGGRGRLVDGVDGGG
jgi:hypothetical protein